MRRCRSRCRNEERREESDWQHQPRMLNETLCYRADGTLWNHPEASGCQCHAPSGRGRWWCVGGVSLTPSPHVSSQAASGVAHGPLGTADCSGVEHKVSPIQGQVMVFQTYEGATPSWNIQSPVQPSLNTHPHPPLHSPPLAIQLRLLIYASIQLVRFQFISHRIFQQNLKHPLSPPPTLGGLTPSYRGNAFRLLAAFQLRSLLASRASAK